MAKSHKKQPAFGKKTEQKKQVTLLYIEDSGKVASFYLRKGVLVGAIIFVFALFVVSVSALIMYTDMLANLGIAQSALDAAQKNIETISLEKEGLAAQLLMLRGNNQQEDNISQGTDKKKDRAQIEEPVASGLLAEKYPLLGEEGILKISDFKLKKARKTNIVKYEFILKKKSEKPKKISGFIFVLVKPIKQDSASWWTAPKASLQKGAPDNFKKGQPFSISKRKTVQGSLGGFSKKPEEISVLAYSDSGELLLKTPLENPLF
ncbi:MAG: hypothetical protein V1753_10990 [Pseudomonadota bacterium]